MKFPHKTLKVVSKDAIKKILGKSPDYSNILAYANWVKTYRGVNLPYISFIGGIG